jgi:hypothetical protein
VPLGQLEWHEKVESRRLVQMVASLANEPLREPVHVALTQGRYILLDGAHRSRALAILGATQVTAHLVDVSPSSPVAGWTHVLDGSEQAAALAALAGPQPCPASRVVARVHLADRWADVWSSGPAPEDIWQRYHDVGRVYQGALYSRQVAPDVPNGRVAVTWLLPAWSDVSTMALEHGPLPAGVTRLGGLLDATCAAAA